MKLFKKTIEFIDADGRKAKIDIEITHRNGYAEFTMCANYMGSAGQCLDKIKPATNSQEKLLHFWKQYHLKNVEKLHGFRKELLVTIESIENFEKRSKEIAEKKDRTEEEKTLELMHEQGIDDDQLEAVKAYIDNATGDDDLSDFNESYSGEFDSDEAFAEEMADQIGAVNDNLTWPNNCIDWEQAARELMQDYFESNGFYFRRI